MPEAGQGLSFLAASLGLELPPRGREGSLGSTRVAPGIMSRSGPAWAQSLRAGGGAPTGRAAAPFPVPRPHQQKQSYGHQDGTATHSRQAQEVQRPAPSPLDQEHLPRESGLGGGRLRHRTGEALGGWGGGGDAKPTVGASSYRDQGEDRVDHSSSYGGVGRLPYPRCLEDAG